MTDVTLKGFVLRELPGGMAVVFRSHDALCASDTVILPKSQIAVVKGAMGDEVTMPEWLARERGLWPT